MAAPSGNEPSQTQLNEIAAKLAKERAENDQLRHALQASQQEPAPASPPS